MSSYRALIPVKALADAKSRLAPHLSAYQREALVLDMLSHVIKTLRASQVFAEIAVVSPDTRVLELAASWGASAHPELVHGHNPALQAAAQQELAMGTEALLTISADLPLLSTNDIRQLFALSEQYQVVLAPERAGSGTNALLLRPPLLLPYLFGIESLRRYREAAQQQGFSYTTYQSLGLALDIDTIDDLHLLDHYTLQVEA